MHYCSAKAVIGLQMERLKRVSKERIHFGGYEFRTKLVLGFSPCVVIDYRKDGKRNFKYFGMVSLVHCNNGDEADRMVREHIAKNVNKII